MFSREWWLRLRWQYALEWALIVAVAYFYTAHTLLDFDPAQLQHTGEHNESAAMPMLVQQSFWRYQQLPLWNHYTLTGFPFAGDPHGHFWNPVSTIPILIWGAINGMKVAIFLSFIIAGIGQWLFAQVFGIRSAVRLWSALMFMLSGGLALLWRSGWYQLVIGLAWFPWCFAALWWALRRTDYVSLILTTFCIAMVLTAGGGYYPFYLLGCLGVLTLAATVKSIGNRKPILIRALLIAGLSAGLLGVMLVPIMDVYPHMIRRVGGDLDQRFSQPIPYALINYIVSEPEWNSAESLGSGLLWTWFYIGWLPFIGVALASATFVQARSHRWALITAGTLLIVLLAWHANRYTPFRYVYDLLPFLYQLRFPGRLLIVATSPLLVVAGFGLQQVLLWNRRWARRWARRRPIKFLSPILLRKSLDSLLLAVCVFTLADVFRVNQDFNFAPGQRNLQAVEILDWLKNYDPDLYYLNAGGNVIYWDWTVATYEAEIPMINFEYGRSVAPQDQTYELGSPPVAAPRYMILHVNIDPPPGLELVKDFGPYQVWRVPDALPFAFVANSHPSDLTSSLSPNEVVAASARFDGPNRIVVEASGKTDNDRLVVLVSDFPGWHLEVDGQPLEIKPISGYLGSIALSGQHTYTFIFQPRSSVIGLAITIITLLVMDGLIWLDARKRWSKPT